MTTTEITGPAWASHYTRLALSEMPADITTATPPQVDEVIRTIDLDRAALGDRYDRAVDVIRRAIGQEPTQERVGHGRARRTVTKWPTSRAEALATARAMDPATASAQRYRGGDTVGEAVAALDAVTALMREAETVVSAHIAEYDRRGGWTRYYRVNNSDGHVHKDRSCRETRVTTQWNWPTSLSGSDSPGVVDASGSLTCLTCFPEVRGTILEQRPPRLEMFETREQTAERTAREQEKADKLAEKIAKGVTPDGSPLEVKFDGRTNQVKTARAAELRYVDCVWNETRVRRNLTVHQTRGEQNPEYVARLRGEIDEYAAAADTLAKALAWKRNTTAETVRSTLAAKVSNRLERGY